MFGVVPIVGPSNVFCDNNGVVKNTTIPESMLAKKHNAINYHAVREAVAAKIIRVGKEDGMTNLADLFTKVLTADRRRASVCCHLMYKFNDGMPLVIDRRVGEVFYPLEWTRSAGYNTMLSRTIWVNHSTTIRAHDLRGAFKYEIYWTETASTAVGDERHGKV
jgi:hypothetical protein